MAFKMKRSKGNFPFKRSPLKLISDPYQVDMDEQLEHAARNAAGEYKAVFDRHSLGHNQGGGDFTSQPGYIPPNLHKVQSANRTLEHKMDIIADRMNKRHDYTSGKTAKLNKLFADRPDDWHKGGTISNEEWIAKQKNKLGMKSKSEVESKSSKASHKIKKSENWRSDFDNTKV